MGFQVRRCLTENFVCNTKKILYLKVRDLKVILIYSMLYENVIKILDK